MTTPDIVIYVRHSAGCKYEGDELARRCTCRKWLRWTHNGRRNRKPAETRSWAEAERVKRDIEDQLLGRTEAPDASTQKLVAEAINLFIAEKKIQGISDDRLARYVRELRAFQREAERAGALTVSGVSREILIGYQSQWERLYPSSNTRESVRARLRCFLDFCVENRWMEHAPKLATVTGEERPTIPLTEDDFNRLLAAIPRAFPPQAKPGMRAGLRNYFAEEIRTRASRMRGLVLLMRYSGLAIMDASTLPRSGITKRGGRYRVTTKRQKTGVHVSVVLQPAIAETILAAENRNPTYLFWTGEGKKTTVCQYYARLFRALFDGAGIPRGDENGNMVSHRLRDTFACDLLQKGVPLEEVSKLLGHESIKTTERHYAKWVKSRQDRLDDLVTATWKPQLPTEARPN